MFYLIEVRTLSPLNGGAKQKTQLFPCPPFIGRVSRRTTLLVDINIVAYSSTSHDA